MWQIGILLPGLWLKLKLIGFFYFIFFLKSFDIPTQHPVSEGNVNVGRQICQTF